MKHLVRILSFSLALFGSIGVAQAATALSHSRKYFDESGALVGEQYLLCSNHSGHGGNIHTAYFIDEQTGCPGALIDPDTWIIPGKIVTAYTLPGSLSITTACSVASCQNDSSPEVNVLTLWTYDVGWQ